LGAGAQPPSGAAPAPPPGESAGGGVDIKV